MSACAELVNAILNVSTELKRDNNIKHVMIHYAFVFCVFISASVWLILVFFQAHLVYFRETEVATWEITLVAYVDVQVDDEMDADFAHLT